MSKLFLLLIVCGCVFGSCRSPNAQVGENIEDGETEMEETIEPKLEEFNFGPNPGD